jgi:hypothetical protein
VPAGRASIVTTCRTSCVPVRDRATTMPLPQHLPDVPSSPSRCPRSAACPVNTWTPRVDVPPTRVWLPDGGGASARRATPPPHHVCRAIPSLCRTNLNRQRILSRRYPCVVR